MCWKAVHDFTTCSAAPWWSMSNNSKRYNGQKLELAKIQIWEKMWSSQVKLNNLKDTHLSFLAYLSALASSHLSWVSLFCSVQGVGRHTREITDPSERPSTSAGRQPGTFTDTRHREEAVEEEDLDPGVTDLQERFRTSPALRSTLEHIVQQLDILTQVRSKHFS